MNKNQILGIVKKNINLGGLAADLLDEALEPALQKVVDDSSNPYDNMLMVSAYPILEKELKIKIEELVNELFKVETPASES